MDLLGNPNRRRILRLLSQKPCYVTEISETLKISPKAVIEHLEALEASGIIECFYGEQKRKYYYVSKDLHMEIFLSPFNFEISCPNEEDVDLKTLRERVNNALERVLEDMEDISERIKAIRSLMRELSTIQRALHSEFVKLVERSILERSNQTLLELEEDESWR